MIRMKRGGESELPQAPGVEAGSISGGRYQLEALLGRGGVGSVHRAYDRERRAYVALKRLDFPRPDGHSGVRADEGRRLSVRSHARRRAQLVALFQREFHTLAQLSHPRII